ncbi:SDR family NAD(P)-dependent oxidoreductase [Roseomonas sp. USHLN139]|uniref:SDR family NAD(P)-dependent oxidoreductase n=1 Tax=Roseomonas sp. USHLN139 TaxID=3081298 RepID=UPI003B0149D8
MTASLPNPAPLLDRYAAALLDALPARPAAAPRHARLAAALAAQRAALGPVGPVAEERASLLAAAPGLAPHAALLERCAESLAEVLADRRAATAVLFPEGSSALVEPLYRGNPWSDRFNALLAAAVRRAATDQAATRIIEIGAGTGGASAAVLAALDGLDPARITYLYTDVSPGFLQHGRRHFAAGRPWLDFRRLDLEADPAAQGFAAGGFDIVIASNVVHATRRIEASLARLRGLLRPGGLLLLNELTQASLFSSLTFGLLDGWWGFEDAAARDPHGPLLSLPRWRQALAATGFADPGAIGLGADPEASFQCLIVAEAGAVPALAGAAPSADPLQVEAVLAAELARALALAPEEIDRQRPFAELGVDSIVAPQLVAAANAALGCALAPADLFAHATLAALARHVAASLAPAATPAVPAPVAGARDIAVIGLACRFPGAPDAEAFWQMLQEGRCAVRDIPPERFAWRPKPGSARQKAFGAFLEDHDAFDPDLFRLTWREAAAMSPQQRVFLETAWHALEDAGHGGRALAGLDCGVFVGATHREHASDAEGDSLAALGNSMAILPARLSYLLNLRGPSLPVDTACSSSLIAVHLACQSLLAGECGMALAGGVSVLLTDPRLHRFLDDAGMSSPSGACHAFDAAADGFVPGEGAGMVVLKPLARALAEGDRVLGVIRASGSNQDGRSSGITAPSGPAQTALELAVWQRAGIDPASIGLVEAHGTGTKLGDPIELRALRDAFYQCGATTPQTTPIGSVKTNIGHTLAAAGIASLIKVLLAFRHATIPPSLSFTSPNPQLDLAASPFRVPVAPEPFLARQGAPLRATVSSFGFSGTNAHLVLDAPPALPAPVATTPRPYAFLLSGQTPEALAIRRADLRAWITQHPQAAPRDLAFTLAAGRAHLDWRLAVVASDLAGLAAALAGDEPGTETGAPAAIAAAEAALAAAAPDSDAETLAALYRRGADGDWARFFAGATPPRRLGLPRYPFARQRFAAPRARQPWPVALQGFPAAEHRFQGRPLLPAAAQLDAAFAAAEAAGLARLPCALTGLRFTAPLFADAGIEAALHLQEDAGFTLRETGGDRVFSSGRLEACASLPRGETPAAIAARLGPPQEGAGLYARFATLGFDYGPGLRAIARLQAGPEEVLARLELPAAAPASGFRLHPALLDGAMQAAIGLAAGDLPETVLPAGLEALRLQAPVLAGCWAHLRRRPARAEEPGLQRLDIALLAEDGAPLAIFENLAIRLQPRATTPVHLAAPRPRPVAPVPATPPDWIFAEEARGWWQALGRRPLLVSPGAAFATPGPRQVTLRPAEATDIARLLAEQPAPRRIWHDGSLGFDSLLALLRGLLARDGQPPVELLALHDGGAEGAMARGLGAALARECATLRLGDLALPPEADAVAAASTAPLRQGLVLTPEGGFTEPGFAILPPQTGRTPLVEGGFYVISGGLGGVGQLLARHLIGRWQAKLLLLGRGALDAPRRAALSAITAARGEGQGKNDGEAIYIATDIADPSSLEQALEAGRRRFGPIRGVIHAAGLQRDGLLRRKPASDIEAVLQAKCQGALALDAATRGDPLDFFAMFSSLAGVFGATGQADYAAANAFLDRFAATRQGPGRGLSIGWPFWAEGGMRVTPEDLAARQAATGIAALDTAAGLAAFETALAQPLPHLLVLPGAREAIARFLDDAAHAEAATAAPMGGEPTLPLVTRLFAEATGLPAERLRPDRPFDAYGIDSILVTKLTARLEQALGTSLPPTLLFDHGTLASLAEALDRVRPAPAPAPTPPGPEPTPPPAAEGIAIIGMAGRFPDADTPDELWRHLLDGHDPIRAVPAGRGPGDWGIGRGGFLTEVDRFDPLFFGIAPAEAARMDPQERKFLETCWEALEDSGHTRDSLAGTDRQGGVFVGVMYGDYALLAAEAAARDGAIAGAAPYWSVANRVSYVFDLRGPSLAVDTACSASLSALHLACRALENGECRVAIAGGVTLSLHPQKFAGLQQGQFASSDGRCRSFAEGGDGYVPGEGVGAVILKPLATALADGDPIHAVIRGSALNHGGRSNGYTVPSPARQAEVIAAALDRAGVPAESVSVIEAHGTGTALGDPIEIVGLAAAFGPAVARQSVALGSLKASHGHLEAAAGIAGLIKLVLQLRHRRLPPMPAYGGPNRRIDFAATPFRLQLEAADWTGPHPLRAGLSGFGAGGANAHLVLQEAPPRAVLPVAAGPALILLSARTEAQLRAYADRLATALPDSGARLADIAHTLQAGREAMPARLGFVAASLSELVEGLAGFAAGRLPPQGFFGLDDGATPPAPPPPGAPLAEQARAFAAGALLAGPPQPGQRVPLPPHPFLGQRHWLPGAVANAPQQHWTPQDALVRDHRVAGRLLLPGAALLQLALAARPGATTLSDIAWLRSAAVPEAGLSLQVETDAQGFTIAAAGEELARGRYAARPLPPLPAPPGAIVSRLGAEAIYARLAGLGLEYGPSLALVEAVESDGIAIRAALRPEAASASLAALVDAAFQALIGLAPEGPAALRIPFALEALALPGDPAAARQVIGRRRPDASAGEARYDIALLDAAGQPVLRLAGLATRPARAAATALPAPCLLQPVWRAAPPLAVQAPAVECLLLRRPGQAVPAALAALPACDPGDLAALARLAGASTGLIWLAPGQATDPAAPALALLAALQALAPAGGTARPLFLLAAGEDRPGPVDAALFGLAKCAALELPGLALRLVLADAAALAAPDLLPRLLAEPAASPAQEIAWRGPARLVRQLVPLPQDSAEDAAAGGTWLLVGGAGGIGRVLAEDILARDPAAHVALVGRRAPDAALAQRIAASQGRLRHLQADATDAVALSAALAGLRALGWPRLDTAVQAALVLRDRPLLAMTPEDFRAAFAPRALATRALETALAAEPHPPRRLVLFSSANAGPGSPGQANYVAGSSFAEALLAEGERPWHRQVLAWGLWGEVGAVADAATQARMARLGVHPILPGEGLSLWRQVLASGAAHSVAVKAEPGALRQLGLADPCPAAALLATAEATAPPAPPLAPAIADFAALEAWGRHALLVVLRGMGDGLPSAYTPAGLARRLGIAPRHATLFAALLGLLERAGLARQADGLWRFAAAAVPEAPQGISIDGPRRLLQAVLDHYPALLRGTLDPVEVLFPQADTALVEGAYAGNPVADRLNALLAASLAAQAAKADPARPFRVIEIGAGTGASSAALLPALAALGRPVEYLFTDISRHFLTRAEANFRNHPFLRTALYDAERDAAANGQAERSFDAVVATNVLHATASLSATLQRLARLLRPGGLFALNEVTRAQDFATIVFGLTEGWWRGAAEPGRLPGAPLADAPRWQALLRQAGCEAIAAVTPAAAEGGAQTLLLGLLPAGAALPEAPAAIRPVKATPIAATQPAAMQPTAAGAPPPRLVGFLRGLFAAVLKLPPEELRLHQGFDGVGLESLSALELRGRIAERFPEVPATLLFEHNSLARLATHLAAAYPAEAAAFLDQPAQPVAEPAPASTPPAADERIAIIGFAGRFPGGETPEDFWQLLESGGQAVRRIPAERWDVARWQGGSAEPGRSRSPWAGCIEGVDLFDPRFFGLSPLEAESMDPQERLFLQTAWHLLEAAGTTPARLVAQAGENGVGVFVGAMNNPYQWLAAEAWAAGHASAGASQFWSIANRVSHRLDLGGPSLAVDTACSSSLTALHLACESLRRGECGAAIAGGVNLLLHPRQLVNLSAAGMISAGPECRAFAEGADGFVDAEGVGAVLLKPLAAALRDGDRIEAVILGSAMNSGGRTSGFTVPSPRAQARAIRQALSRAGVPAESVSVVEAHGTGTALGDPIELAGLVEGYGAAPRPAPVLLGALKANIGHLESAAGIAGLTKLLLQLRHRRIAPHPHAATPNPLIRFEGTPFRLPAAAQNWTGMPKPGGGHWPRRAGLSAFGAGGANVHLLLEEAPPAPPALEDEAFLVPLSATDSGRLADLARRLLDWSDRHPEASPGAIAASLRRGRVALACRAVLRGDGRDALREALAALAEGLPPGEHRRGRARLIIGGAPSASAPLLAESTEGQALLRALLAAGDGDRLARLWAEGAAIDWAALPGGTAPPLPLPGYPFARERHWLPAGAAPAEPTAAAPAETALLARGWQEVRLPEPAPPGPLLLLGAADSPELAAALAEAWPGPCRRLDDPAAAEAGATLIDLHAPRDDSAGLARLQTLLAALLRDGPTELRLLRPGATAAETAMLRTAALEGLAGATALRLEGTPEARDLASLCRIEAMALTPQPEVLWRDGRRFLPVLQRLAPALARPVFQPGRAYLLAGGLGEVGRALAAEALAVGAHLAILGQRDAAAAAPVLAALRQDAPPGAVLAYAAADLADAAALAEALARLRRALGDAERPFAGVLHLARAVADGPLAAKDAATLEAVLAPKLAGSLALDAALAGEPLDFFILCGSLAGWFGLAGGGDYAAACAWQGDFAARRQARVLRGERQGQSLAIAWPQWAYDRHGSAAKAAALAARGLVPLQAAAGLAALGAALAAGQPELAVVAGEAACIAGLAEAYGAAAALQALPPDGAIGEELAALSDAELAAYLAHLQEGAVPLAAPAPPPIPLKRPAPLPPAGLQAELARLLAAHLKLPPDSLDAETAFAGIGLDSIRALQAAEKIGRHLGLRLDPVVFFEHPTLGRLAAHLEGLRTVPRLEAGE